MRKLSMIIFAAAFAMLICVPAFAAEKEEAVMNSQDELVSELIDKGTDKVLEKIGAEDEPATSGIKSTLQNVATGDFSSAKKAGTDLTTQAFIKQAAGNSLVKKLMGYKVSKDMPSAILEKRIENVCVDAASRGAQAAGACALINGGVAAIESIAGGDDAYLTTGKVLTAATKGAVSSGVGVLAGEAAVAGLAAVGVTGTLTAAVPAATCALVVGAVITGLDALDEKYDIDAKVAAGARTAVEAVGDASEVVAEKTVEATGTVKTKTIEAADTVKNKTSAVAKTVKDATGNATESVKSATVNAAESVKNSTVNAAKSVKNATVNAAKSVKNAADATGNAFKGLYNGAADLVEGWTD